MQASWLLAVGLLTCGIVSAAELGPELVPNGDMEQDSDWTSSNCGSEMMPKLNEQSPAEKHGGQASRHIVISRPTTNEWPGVISPFYSTRAGKSYQVSFWYKVTTGSFTLLAREGQDNNNTIPDPEMNLGPRPDGAWSQYTGTYTDPTGGDRAYLRFIPASAFDVDFYLDDVSVREADMSPGAALRQWRAVRPNRPYVCWTKSPWDHLNAVTFPADNVQDAKALAVSMGRKEYESASFVITNLSDSEQAFSISSRPSKLALTLRQAMWVTDAQGGRCNDALPLLEGPLAIPSGESREVWLTVETRGEKAGDYQTGIEIKAASLPTTTIPLRVKVYPVELPDDKPLYTQYWDYLVPRWHGPELTQAYIADLRAHYVNVGIMHPWPARMQFDEAGELKLDWTDLDATLEAYRALNPKLLLLNFLCEVYMEKHEDYMTEPWQARFKVWLPALVKHLAEQGFGYDRIVIYPYDETIGPKVAAMARLIKETDPKLRVYINTVGQSEEEIRNIAPYGDIWSPYLYDYLGWYPYDRPAAVREEAKRLLRKDEQSFWTYANPLTNQPKLAPPYKDYRLVPWRAWSLGMGGTGYWIYNYKTHWNSYQHEDGANWAVVYLANAPDAPPGLSKKELVVPSKRWEATREGVEDYSYLHMLREAIAAAEQRKASAKAVAEAKRVLEEAPAAVLAEDTNAALADAAKERVVGAIGRLDS